MCFGPNGITPAHRCTTISECRPYRRDRSASAASPKRGAHRPDSAAVTLFVALAMTWAIAPFDREDQSPWKPVPPSRFNATSSSLPVPARAIAEQRVRRAGGDAPRPAGRGPHRRRAAQHHGGRSRQRRRGYGYAVRGIVGAGPRRAVRPHRQTRHDCSANEQIVCEADTWAKAPVTARGASSCHFVRRA